MKFALYRTVLVGLAVGFSVSGAAIAQSDKDIPVGVMTALSGVYGYAGLPIENGVKLALEEANQKGLPSGGKFRILTSDTAGDKNQVINLVNKLIKRDRVMVLIGPNTSSDTLAGAPLANESKVPMMSGGSQNAILDTGPYAFKVQAFANDIMGYLGKLTVEKLSVKRITLVFDRSSEAFVAQKDALRDYVKAAGVQIVSEEPILATDTDFVALSTKISNQQTDAVFISAPAELAANFVIQVRQAGLDSKVKFIGPSTLSSPSFIKTGGKAVEGTFLVADWAPTNPSPLNVAFMKAYTARFKSEPDNFAAMGYTQGQLVAQAVQNAGPNPTSEKIRVELSKLTKVPVVMGNGLWSVSAGRQPSYGGVLLTVKNGAFVAAE